jgi:hypothetical protein
LEVLGSNLKVKGTNSGSIVAIENYKADYGSITSPTGAKWKDGNIVDGSDNIIKAQIVYTPWKYIEAKGVEDGSATFTLKKKDDPSVKFTGKGWFESGTDVVITCEPAKGYEFGHWSTPLDANYKDPETKLGAEREVTASALDQTFIATLYYKPKSSANWYGVVQDPDDANKYKFTQFSLNNHGTAEVTRATNSTGEKVQAGEYNNGRWYYINTSDHKLYALPFGGGIENGKAIEGDIAEEGSASSSITDMAYDFKGGELYGIGGQKLYIFDDDDDLMKEVGSLEYKSVATSAVAMSIDAKGTMYFLSGGTPGKLFTLDKIDETKVILKEVGEEAKAGAMDVDVDGSKQQSIAFDHATGELFWGDATYIRMIDLNDATTKIVGDVGNTNGKQGYIKAMHRMDKKVTVTAKTNEEEQENWGTVSVGTSTYGASKSQGIIAGTKVNINAKASAGYHFVYWTRGSWTSETTYEGATKEISASSSVTYWAHFAVGAEGITEISIDPTLDVQKVLIDGQIYIVRDGRVYTITGAMVQ